MRRPVDRDRWLALALLLAALALGYLVLVHPWWTAPMLEAQGRIDQLRERELRVRTQLGQAPQVQRLLEAARAQAPGTAGFLPEATTELATAGLVQRLETEVARASPGNVACAITNRAPVTLQAGADGYVPVGVDVRMQCGMAELAAVLHALEGGTPRLFVEDLNLLPMRHRMLGPVRGEGAGGVDVNFQLVGYLAPVTATATEVGDAP